MAEINGTPAAAKRKGPVRELVETVLLALLIALAIRTFVVEVYRVQGSSMEATMSTGERVLVNKFLLSYIRDPKPGDIIVFQYPRQPDRDFIKRVVAVEGDTVLIRAGRVYVNGVPFPEATTVLMNGRDEEEITVPPDSVWVLGDNRDNSEDSRMFGQVPLKNIRGLAFMRIWPLGRLCIFANPVNGAGAEETGGFMTCR